MSLLNLNLTALRYSGALRAIIKKNIRSDFFALRFWMPITLLNFEQ